MTIRVVLPPHLRTLARVDGELDLQVKTPVSQRAVLDAIEAKYPMLRGTIRDHVTQLRRPMVRFFACGEELGNVRSEEHTSELQSHSDLVCRLLLEKKKKIRTSS